MAISYTTNFKWAKLDDAGQNWGAVWNGVLEDLDLYLAEARNPLIWENYNDDHLLITADGKELEHELLVYDDEVLLYA